MTATPGSGEIGRLRDRIDAVNVELLRLLERRGELTLAIARLKGENAIAFRDLGREKAMLNSILAQSRGLYLPVEIEAVFERILFISRAFARRALSW